MTNWKSDLHVGGRWSVVVQNADGRILPASGEYVEIEPSRKVVLRRRYEWDFPQLGRRATMVTYRLDPIATGTRVTVRHDGFSDLRAPADQHAEGWERMLGWLDVYSRREGAGEGRQAQVR